MSKRDQTVLLFKSIYPQQTGGMEVYNYNLSKHLLTDEYPGIIMLSTYLPFVDNKRVFRVRSRIFGLTRWGLSMLSVFVSCIFSRHIQMSRWKTVMIPHTSNFDDNAWPVILFSKLFGFNYTVHCHSGGKDRVWKSPRQQIRLFKGASRIAAVSSQIIEDYQERSGCRIDYWPPLVKCEKTDLTKEEIKKKYRISFDKVILYVGSIKQLKSPCTLLKAFESLPDAFCEELNLGLVMAGDGDMRREMEEKYGANSRIMFMGWVRNEDVKELYAVADLYVISSWYEGTPLSLLEAMFNGVCCLGSDVEGINAVIKDGINGYLFPKEDSDTLCGLIQKCISDEQNAKEIGAAAKCYYNQNYSYDKHLCQVLQYLDYKQS